MRGLRNREVGALEAADTLLGISLYGTDPNTTIKWIDIGMVRRKKVKDYKEIKDMDADSTDIFCKSLVDDHYPQRPEQLESMCLYDFCAWFDIIRSKPKTNGVEYYTLKPFLFLRKRTIPHLINHWRYNVNTQPGNFFYGLLLLFRPWRDTDELKGSFASYTESFAHQKNDLLQACEYHNRLEDFQRGLDSITGRITDELNKGDDEAQSSATGIGCEPKVAEVAMKEFQDIGNRVAKNTDLPTMISQMNADQRRIFNKVTHTLLSKNETLRLYVSGEGGTGKSFLIDVIRTWISKELDRKTALTAPTGIAAFNINGLTIHRYFQLPIEHGSTPKYRQLSDNVLKVMREEMRDVESIIIDEISMVSNVTLMYINQRLMEIFDSFDNPNGWFGNKHILVFGDLMLLPPVMQDPTYIRLSSGEIEKRLGSMLSVNLWVDLFSHDELTINMRQKTDLVYAELLARLRIGHMTGKDIKLLESRKCPIILTSIEERSQFPTRWIESLPSDTVCLLATRKQCDCLNTLMLQEICSDEITLTAEDSIDCRNPRLRNKAMKILEAIEHDDR
uniref:ATP-dependent DNA helicase n=1 Tax=Bracon brevicornis TaxID=1563983 RepID=A0A6V7J942_9HYME